MKNWMFGVCASMALCISSRAIGQTIQPNSSRENYNAAWVGSENGTSILQTGFSDFSDTVIGAVGLFRPRASYSIQYGNNLPSIRGEREDSYVQKVLLGFGLRFAERFSLSYSPSYTWYSAAQMEDQISHQASLSAGWQTGQFGLGLTQSYTATSEPLVETGAQTYQESWGTTLSAGTAISDTASADVVISQQIRNTDAFADVTTWSGFGWLRKRYSESLTLSVGAGGGYSSIDPGSDLLSRQLKAGLGWTPGERLHIDVELGVDYSKLMGSEVGDVANPIYGLNFQYRLSEVTSFSLGARRSVTTSYFSNQYNESARYNFSVSQRLLGRLNLNLGVSLSDNDYISKSMATANGRSDQQTTYSAQLSTPIWTKFFAAVSYQHVENDSSLARYALSSDSYGFSISWQY